MTPDKVAPADVTTTPTTVDDQLVGNGKPAAVKRGQAVTFSFTDPITGVELDGAGVALRVTDDVVVIAPLQHNYLHIAPSDVQAVELDD